MSFEKTDINKEVKEADTPVLQIIQNNLAQKSKGSL
jgi:hypothetical protein